MDSETIRFIRTEIARQLNVILQGQAADSDGQTESIDQLFPGMPRIPSRPVMHPFGLMSTAPDGTLSVVARQGEHVGNRLVLGHRDKNAPSTITGEVVLYDAYGHKVELRDGGMALRAGTRELFEVMIRLLTTIINARVNTILGPQPLIPDPAGAAAKQTFVDVKSDLVAMKGDT